MIQEYQEIIWELFDEAKKLDRFCLTSKQWREFEFEIYDLFKLQEGV